jgi:hypothetical protein
LDGLSARPWARVRDDRNLHGPEVIDYGMRALKERERDDRDDEIARLKSKVGEITMDNELLCAKIAALEAKRPLDQRRPRR